MSFLIIFSAGCQALEKKPETLHADDEKVKAFKKTDYEQENYVRVQDYTGEGFELRDSKEINGEIARSHQKEVEKGVKEFFLKNYRTEVEVNDIVSAKDGAVVYVESIHEPKFHTFAIVPVNSKNKTVSTDRIWSLEGQVESAIAGGLYVLAFKEKFQTLDTYLHSMITKHPIVGKSDEMITNIGGEGYLTPYYFLLPVGNVYNQLVAEYIENPAISIEEIRKLLLEHKDELHEINISIEFFMEDEYTQPDPKILKELVTNIENMNDIPDGTYLVFLNDNYIDKKRGVGKKENTIKQSHPNPIIKK